MLNTHYLSSDPSTTFSASHSDSVSSDKDHSMDIEGDSISASESDSDVADEDSEDPFDSSDNQQGYDICIECRDCASIPSAEQIKAAEAHLAALDEIDVFY